jgi:hypothetical protein
MSDIFCVLDSVQFTRSDYISRNRIHGPNGPAWLSVPVYSTGHSKDRICDIRIVHNDWQRTHLDTLRHSYRKAPYFADYFSGFERILLKKHEFISDLDIETLTFLTGALGIKKTIVRTSDYEVPGKKSDYLIQLCRHFGASAFLFGSMGRNYADADSFKQAGIQMLHLAYRYPVYRQRGTTFVPNLSIIDLLFNEGPNSLEILAGADSD